MSNPYAAPGTALEPEPAAPEEHPAAPPPRERPKARAGATFVEIARSTDRLEAHDLVELLESEGIPTQQTGTASGAIIGAGESLVDLVLSVPEENVEAATELVEAFRAGIDDDTPDDEPAALARKPGGFVRVLAWLILLPTLIGLLFVLLDGLLWLFR